MFAVDGRIEPYDEEIYGLHGTRYEELPVEWRRKFDQFSIRVFKIVEFEPEEPAELFFRLNQPTKLTSAEQRNAFFGPARSLVKKLASSFNDVPIGFSNARMAVDDVVARVLHVRRKRYCSQKGDCDEVSQSRAALILVAGCA